MSVELRKRIITQQQMPRQSSPQMDWVAEPVGPPKLTCNLRSQKKKMKILFDNFTKHKCKTKIVNSSVNQS